ncbi:ankyrin repeat domain-containing protein 18B [Phycodurus eques]|uniref:ankyrin repeat domain-containing protein 18B n=1 Tax=Phycodurus eques TaxID=693459 RepID=UPI002ACEEE3C|nr:ankyrin repeat domain-containing protein 18B [Phycodurus eques]
MMRPKDLRQSSGTKTFLDAMHGGKVHLARFILDALDGRIVNSKTENSRTPLIYAVCLQEAGTRAKFARLLLEKGADVNCQDEEGRTALSHACELGNLDVVKILVQFNADPDICDVWGNSALMYAAFSGHSQVLEFLVRAFKRLGLRLDRMNNAGHTAIEVADFFGHNQCVQILNLQYRRSVGADDSLADPGNASDGEFPNRLPRHVLERFSKQMNSKEEQLPGVFQKQMNIQEGNRPWNRFTCPRKQSHEQNHRHKRSLPTQKGQTEGHQNIFFTTKQLQNCQLHDPRGTRTLDSPIDTTAKEVKEETGPQEKASQTFRPCGKAKSFNQELLSIRKQSYQGDEHDLSLSASKFKRASLQDDRCLLDKMECQGNPRVLTNDVEKTVSVPKGPLGIKTQLVKGPEEKSKTHELQKRASFAHSGRHNKMLFGQGETEAGKMPGRGPGFMGFGTRLLRRFTAPEFMRMVIDCSSGSSNGRGRMSRSETFPFSHTHRQVNSQPSVDSISGVKCEFESCSSQSALD